MFQTAENHDNSEFTPSLIPHRLCLVAYPGSNIQNATQQTEISKV